MDDSRRILQDFPQSSVPNSSNSDSLLNHSDLPAACAVCQKILLPDDEGTGELEPISMCGDCKFLFLEDLRSPMQDSHWRRPPRVRRTRYSSSESIENLFSQQFSNMINLVRQNQSTVSGHEDQLADADAGARLLQRPSSRTTPSGSRRWRRVLSDTESDGFDNLDSLYGESESNVSFGGYRLFNGESDAISFSAYGGDSDASMDGNSFLDTEMFVQLDDGSNPDSDTDIDPMHARLSQWNSDDQEDDDDEDEEDEDGEWEEADPEENVVESAEAEVHPLNSFPSSSDGSNVLENMIRRINPPEFLHPVRQRYRTVTQTFIANLDGSETLPYFGNSEDYLDARGFEEFLEHLAATDTSRRGAPPAAVSFVNSLPRVVINDEHEKGLVCAICKDVLSVGTEVNQLPCSHLYHPSCILPWLTARNSCPLCRYELPTDDKDYEEGKLNSSIHEIPQQESSDDSSSDTSDGGEADEEACEISPECREQEDEASVMNNSSNGEEGGRGRNRWLFLAAAPIVGLVGMALVLWLNNPAIERRGAISRSYSQGQAQLSSLPDQTQNRSRRWWSLF